ncbi:MAG: hypothetical protein IAE67_04135 [Candidatus Competibacteraceae bacterium]|nr:hypothetical protein [Candidatus Competibacteraceae bacterium]
MESSKTEPPSSNNHSGEANQFPLKSRLHQAIRFQHFRRRERIKPRVGLMLFVYACMLIMLGYLLIEIMKLAKG